MRLSLSDAARARMRVDGPKAEVGGRPYNLPAPKVAEPKDAVMSFP